MSVEGSEVGKCRQGRKIYTINRPEEPPRNGRNQMTCKYTESNQVCVGLTFNRRCEWNKHMDKHERPYKCTSNECEKLEGFTYAGGLLRHEREVHKMHGQTKNSVFCPYTDCARSSGTGFTRKDNLADHIRRVHRTCTENGIVKKLSQSNVESERETQMSVGRLIDIPLQDGSHGVPPEAGLQLDAHNAENQDRKRKRMSIDAASKSGFGKLETASLYAEVKRLRMENEERDTRLKTLEGMV